MPADVVIATKIDGATRYDIAAIGTTELDVQGEYQRTDTIHPRFQYQLGILGVIHQREARIRGESLA